MLDTVRSSLLFGTALSVCLPERLNLKEINDCHAKSVWWSSWLLGDCLTGSSDNLSLGLRLSDTGKTAEEKLGSVDNGEVDTQVLVKGFLDLLALVQAHQTLVNQDSYPNFSTNAITSGRASFTHHGIGLQ
jgi:hypothetical protein